MSRRSLEPLDLSTANITDIVMRADHEEFARRGTLAGLSTVQVTDAVYAVLAAISSSGLCVHRDYPVCSNCRGPVGQRRQEYRQWAATTGAQIAGDMHEKNLVDRDLFLAAEAAK